MSVCTVFASLGLARFGYSMVLPSMQAGLGLTNTQAGALATANLAGYLIMSAIAGAIALRFGARATISAGLALAGASMVLTGLARSWSDAAALRFVTGTGSAAANVVVMGLISAWFGPQRRGFAAGIAVTGSSFALILLGSCVPRIVTAAGAAGWRTSWFLFGAAALMIAICAAVVLRNKPQDQGLAPFSGDSAPAACPAEKDTPARLASVYVSKTVWRLGLVYAAFGFSYIIYMTFFAKYLIAEARYTREAAGRLFMTMGWFALLCGVLWGSLSDKAGRKRTLVALFLVHAVAFGLFAVRPAPAAFIVSAVLFGLSAWSIPAIMAAACGDVVGPRLAPSALGFITLFFGIGQAFGPAVAGAIADRTGSFSPAFLLAAGVALAGAVAASFLRPLRPSAR